MAYTETVIDGRKVILDENGKPCRSCNTLQDFQMATGGIQATGLFGGMAAPIKSKPQPNHTWRSQSEAYYADPPDSAELGSNTWTFLHSMAAKYPENASVSQQIEMNAFINTFAHYYPCEPCAADFRDWIKDNKPETSGKSALSLWFCDAHNAVNAKLGKPSFDCRNWQARWKDGWDS